MAPPVSQTFMPAFGCNSLHLGNHPVLGGVEMAFEHKHVIAHGSGSRMVAVQRVAQARTDHVCVDFGGRKVGVTEHGLHAAQIGPAFQKMGREGVPQNVRREIVKNTSLLSVEFDAGPERLAGHRAASRGDEKVGARLALEQERPRLSDVFRYRSQRGCMNRDDPLLVALAGHTDDARAERPDSTFVTVSVQLHGCPWRTKVPAWPDPAVRSVWRNRARR